MMIAGRRPQDAGRHDRPLQLPPQRLGRNQLQSESIPGTEI